MAATPGLPNATAAAKACARGRSIDARLGAADLAYASHFVPCMLRAERAQFRLGFHESRSLSRSVARALKIFIAGTQLNHGAGKAAAAFVTRTMTLIAAFSCPRSARYSWAFRVDDSNPPPVMTPVELATVTAHLFRYPVMHSAKATFGVAIVRGVMFKGNDRHGITTGWLAVRCT